MAELINYIINTLNNVNIVNFIQTRNELSIDKIKELSTDLNYQDVQGYTALHYYLERVERSGGANKINIEIVKLLLTKENVDIETYSVKLTPFHMYIIYCSADNLEIVKLLATVKSINMPYVYSTFLEYYIHTAHITKYYKDQIIKYLIDIGGTVSDNNLFEFYYYKYKIQEEELNELKKIKNMSCILENSIKKYL